MAAEPSAARNDAIRALARREYGVWELTRKLVQKGHDSAVVADVVAVLEQQGMLSDERYAKARANSLVNRGYGPRRIERELNEKHIAQRIVTTVLERPKGYWDELAARVRSKKFGPPVPTDFKEKARQMRFLQYRGFSSGQISRAVNADETIE